MRKLSQLHGIDLFSKLPKSIIDTYFSHCLIREYRKKEIVFSPDQHSASIYLVTAGRIRVYLSYPNGKEFTLTILESGHVYSGHTRAFGQAITDCEIVFVPIESFRALLTEVPAFSMSVISVLGDSLKNSLNIIENLVFKEVNKRLYQYIYGLAVSARGQEATPVQVILGLTHHQIATMIGSTRQTVSTFFSHLQKEGLIAFDKDKLTIIDFEAIAARARDDDE